MAEERQNRWSSMVAPLASAAVGFAVGAIIGGGRLVRVFDWTTEWNVDAPRSEVFRVLSTPEEQHHWWPSMIVEHVEPIPEVPDGRIITYRVLQAPSVRRIAPPFILTSTIADVEHDRRTRAVVTGDLAGVLETLLYDRPDGGTRVVYHWYTRVTNPLMNALGFVLTPVFRASHDHVMREGEAGLRQYCAARQAQQSAVQVSMNGQQPEV
ncbi:MAG TPA: hypothetical protein VF040_13865 [Ktedonobacterales bacterium]